MDSFRKGCACWLSLIGLRSSTMTSQNHENRESLWKEIIFKFKIYNGLENFKLNFKIDGLFLNLWLFKALVFKMMKSNYTALDYPELPLLAWPLRIKNHKKAIKIIQTSNDRYFHTQFHFESQSMFGVARSILRPIHDMKLAQHGKILNYIQLHSAFPRSSTLLS